MRPAVGLILSHGGVEAKMSRPDYEQNALHHGSLLVLLRGVGPSVPHSLQKVFDKVRRINNIKVTDSNGITRGIWVRYVHEYPVENNDWGDFQTHRRLLGLITIGKFNNQVELNELCRQHESLKVRYGNTLYETRAVYFGPEKLEQQRNTPTIHDDIANESNSDNNPIKNLQDEYTTPSNFKAQAFFYRENDNFVDLFDRIKDFINSLFWVLESKRLEKSRERTDKVSLLLAPFEKRDFIGIDMESRNNRKRCVGRVMKNLADLSLQGGLVDDALSLYHNSSETLRSIGDSLWIGATEEGLCAASSILLYPQLRELETYQEGRNPTKWTSRVTMKSVKMIDRNKQQSGEIANNQITSSSCSSGSSITTTNSFESVTTATSSTSIISTVSVNGQKSNELPGNILKAEEIPNYYRKAIINYSKYRHAAIIETESALKAARICIEQNRPLDVAMFLQNILYININMSEPERVKRFKIITDLYKLIGYQRKAAFFQRLAALKHVQQGNQAPDWNQSYHLLLSSFNGYLLSSDPLEVLVNTAGWPSLQIDLLQNLITASRRLGHSALATRHMTFLLQTQWRNMSLTEQSDMAIQLQNLSAQCEGSPVPLVLENGIMIPPANLTDLPYCEDFVVKDLPAHLKPQRIKIAKIDSGPFLFTPIHFSSIDRREKQRNKNKIGGLITNEYRMNVGLLAAFLWVQNDLSEVSLRLRNPLPFELTVSDMRLLTNGIVFESLPQSIVLQPYSPTYITLQGSPIEVGQLDLQGYSTHTLGVKSNCRMKQMQDRNFPPNFLIDVIPSLPRINVKTSLPQTATFSKSSRADIVITSTALTLYNGESSICIITVKNESEIPVEHLEFIIISNVEQEVQNKVFHFDKTDLQSKLPIAPHCSIEINVNIYAESDFVCPIGGKQTASMHSSNGTRSGVHNDYSDAPSFSHISTSSLSGHTSLPFHLISTEQHNQQSLTSTTGAAMNNLLAMHSLQPNCGFPCLPSQFVQHIEGEFRIKYSGGEALNIGYCRQCAIVINLEFLPSIQITSWDVLPAEVPSQFYLVLDITNLTPQELTLNYTDSKSILIEAKESCRVPIPVDRCSLEQVNEAREAVNRDNWENEIYLRPELISFSDSTSKLCSEHIANKVKISWLLTGTDTKGVASLRGIILTAAMTDLTTVSPLEWSVLFQNIPVQPHSEITCTVGQSAIFNVILCNQSLQTLKNLELIIKFYQDYLNGMENYNLETRVAVSGPNRQCIPILQKHEKSHHECSVVFFTPGRFKASIECHFQPMTTSSKCSWPATDINCQLDVPQSNLSIDMDKQQKHIWKFIPPIELTVVE